MGPYISGCFSSFLFGCLNANHGAFACSSAHLPPAQPQTCCSSSSESSTDACFAALGVGGNLFERCVDALVYLDPDQGPSEPLRRCESAVDCGHAQLCVRPRGDQALTALRMRLPTWLRSDADPGDDGEHTIVWQGARSEILRERACPPSLCRSVFVIANLTPTCPTFALGSGSLHSGSGRLASRLAYSADGVAETLRPVLLVRVAHAPCP